MGRDRYINPITKDYERDGHGQLRRTLDASTAIYHQLLTRQGQWVGDPDAGSRLYQLPRKSTQAVALAGADMVREALKPLIEEGLITDSEVTASRDERGDIAIEGIARDIKGNEIDFSDMLSGGA